MVAVVRLLALKWRASTCCWQNEFVDIARETYELRCTQILGTVGSDIRKLDPIAYHESVGS